jgi:hypothetical protein
MLLHIQLTPKVSPKSSEVKSDFTQEQLDGRFLTQYRESSFIEIWGMNYSDARRNVQSIDTMIEQSACFLS